MAKILTVGIFCSQRSIQSTERRSDFREQECNHCFCIKSLDGKRRQSL